MTARQSSGDRRGQSPRAEILALPSGDRWCYWVWGQPSADQPIAVSLHGFSGSGLDWELPVETFGSTFGAWIAPDLPGHGGSVGLSPAAYTLKGISEGLAVLIAGLPRSPVLFGYSMGGRAAFTHALGHQHSLAALVLIGTSPGMSDPREREQRLDSDESLARWIEREGVDAFADRWEELPLLRSQSAIPSPWGERLRRRRREQLPPELARSLRGAGLGTMRLEPRPVAEWRIPTLCVAGANDLKFAAIARELTHFLPGSSSVLMASAGHSAHLETPVEFYNSFQRFCKNRVF